jgi:hypothetical protein
MGIIEKGLADDETEEYVSDENRQGRELWADGEASGYSLSSLEIYEQRLENKRHDLISPNNEACIHDLAPCWLLFLLLQLVAFGELRRNER